MLPIRSLSGYLFLFAVIACVWFGSAGTICDTRFWFVLVAFFGSAGAVTVWLWLYDKPLLERRLKAGPGSESDRAQNVIQALAGLDFLALFAVAGLDRRFGWSDVPFALSIVGDGLIATGFLIVFLTFRENTFTAGTIEVVAQQRVVASGPYAIVRHPMYAGALILILAISLGLGAWFGLIPAILMIPLLAIRLVREEAFLTKHLPGYSSYLERTRHRLVPLVW